MEFYNHRFDFLRKSNESAPGNLSSSTVANTNTYYNNILPFSKETFVDVFSEGEISDLKNKILDKQHKVIYQHHTLSHRANIFSLILFL